MFADNLALNSVICVNSVKCNIFLTSLLVCGDFRLFSRIFTVIAEFPWVTHTRWCICFFGLSDDVQIPHRRWKNVTLFTKEFQKYTKENLPVQYFCSNLSTNGLIFARSSLDCHIFYTLSAYTHIGNSKSHKAIWLYGFMAIIWLYGCNKAVALWLFGYPIWVSMERALKM